MSDQALNWHIEEACTNAWPPLKQAIIHGWQLRFANGFTRRVNSANPLHNGPHDAEQMGEIVQKFYHQQGQPELFRIPSILNPDFKKRLQQQGYKPEGVSNVLFCRLDEFKTAQNGNTIEHMPTPTAEWLAAICTFKKLNDAYKATYKSIVGKITVPAAFAALRYEGRIASMAFGALSDNLLCIESVFTDANYRGRFFAKYMLSAIIDWARQNGANGICLQVEADNGPGNSLYRNLGMREVYRYHYLRKTL